MKPILDGLCRTCDVQLQEERKCVVCFVVARRRENNFQRRCSACANAVQPDRGQALDDHDIVSAGQVFLPRHGESLSSSFSATSSLLVTLRLQAAVSQGIIDGVFTPNDKIRRMSSVEERLAETKRLRCSTCSYEISSSWFLVSSHNPLRVLKPANGHFDCCVGTTISPFTTVDGSTSIPVSASSFFFEA